MIVWLPAFSHWQLSMTRCRVHNNHATRAGSSLGEDLSLIDVFDSTFADNSAATTGGVLYVAVAALYWWIVCIAGRFERVTWACDTQHDGSQVQAAVAVFTLHRKLSSLWRYVRQWSHSGARHLTVLCLRSGVVSSTWDAAVTIESSTFTDNSAATRGGVLELSGRDNHTTIATCTSSVFRSNVATDDGGVFWISSLASCLSKNNTYAANHAANGCVLCHCGWTFEFLSPSTVPCLPQWCYLRRATKERPQWHRVD